MFNNIGGKIKALAKVICWIGIIASIIIGIILTSTSEHLASVGMVIALIGALLSWINSFLLYGFGQLVENSDILVENSFNSDSNDFYYSNSANEPSQHEWRCPECEKMVSEYPCKFCGFGQKGTSD